MNTSIEQCKEYLYLPQAHIESLVRFALEAAPNECCGLLIGRHNYITEVVAVTNCSKEADTRFMMDPRELARLLPRYQQIGYEVIGFYHSHPDGIAVPSATDILELSAYPNTFQIIVGLKNLAPEIGGWIIDANQAYSVEISSCEFSSEVLFINDHLRGTQQATVVIVSAMVAFLLLLLVSFALLPPAPPIP